MWQRLCMITGILAVWTWVALLNLPPYAAIAVSVALVGWYIGFRMTQERGRLRASAALERALLPENAVAAGHAEAKFVAALQEIKHRGTHPAPLVDLPMFVALGASQSGVRSLLAHVGLRWRGREIKPVMGCQWWLDDTCIVLRPTGTDQRAARACMETLRRFRPDGFQGMLVTLSLGDLLDLPEAQLKRNGDELRAQLESLQDPSHARAPVYLAITQADRLPGFTATFAKLTPQQRQHLWGDAFRIRADEQHAQEALGGMLDTMVQQTAAQTLHHMQMSSDVEAREQIYQFPERLAALRGPLLTWSNAFFATTHRRENPRLCGAYVCSAAPKESMAFHGSLPGQASQGASAPFFTSNLLSVGMPPGMDDTSSHGGVAASWARAATLVAASLLLVLPLVSYVSNYLQLSNTRQKVEALVEERDGGKSDHVTSLHGMDTLAELLADLDNQSQQVPYLNARMGMNQSAELVMHLRHLYLTTVRDHVIAPLVAEDANRMEAVVTRYQLLEETPEPATDKKPAPAQGLLATRTPDDARDDGGDEGEEDPGPPGPDEQEYADVFNGLKAYLLCTQEGQEAFLQDAQTTAWLVAHVARRWGQAAGEPVEDVRTSDRLQRHVATYIDAMRQDAALRVARNAELVADVRDALLRVPEEVAVMALLTDGADAYNLTLADLLGDDQLPVRADKKVRGAYTRAGFEHVVRARMAQLGFEVTDSWVLGPEGASQRRAFLEASSSDARDVIYWHNYGSAWHAFVVSLHFTTPPKDGGKDADGAVKSPTQRLAAEYPAAYRRLLQAVKYNLEPAPHRDLQPSASDL